MLELPNAEGQTLFENIIKVQAIEGWFPNTTTLGLLREFSIGSLTEEEFHERALEHALELDSNEPAHKKPPLRRLLFRNSYEDSTYAVLKNVPSLKTPSALHEYQGLICAQAMLSNVGLGLDNDPKKIHWTLFHRSYDWAGKYRTLNLSSKGVHFAPVNRIEEGISESLEHLDQALTCREKLDLPGTQECFARFLDQFLWSHPFRDGNGRTAFFILMQVFPTCDLRSITHKEWYTASQGALQSPNEPSAADWKAIFAKIIPQA